MSKFNLLEEPWISVIIDEKGNSQEVSLKTLLKNAHLYKDLAGDTKTQDFAILRVLLAVLHTIFSRFNANGEVHEVDGEALFELDERYKPQEAVDEAYISHYEDALYQTWFELWEKKHFPNIVTEYLEKWHDRFYLFDDKYPFFQVVKEDILPEKINSAEPTKFFGKNLNRKISESSNKTALFSPKYEKSSNKEMLSSAEIARWLLTLHGYTGLADKVKFERGEYKASKGWLYDIGGIYLNGDNLFETLMLNCVLANTEQNNLATVQTPCWERSSKEVVESHFSSTHANSMASLLTTWSRGVYINPHIAEFEPFSCDIVKLPEIEYVDNFMEMMTVWEYYTKGKKKGTTTPKKHSLNQAVWRSFGLLTMYHPGNRIPGVVEWINKLKTLFPNYLENKIMTISAVGMEADGTPTSRVPVDEILDSLSINELVLTDTTDEGWIIRINAIVEFTERVVNFTYKLYIQDIKAIRNIASNSFVDQRIEELYYKLDAPFRIWLANIEPADSKDGKIEEWKTTLKQLVIEQAKRDVQNATMRDYIGIERNGKRENIASAYNKFIHFVNKEFS